MKIVFFGSPPFAVPIIETVNKYHDLIEIFEKPENFDNERISRVKSLSPDLFVVASYGKILPPDLLIIPRLGSINIHPSLLPKYRGPSPIQTAILNGDKKTGVTFIKMDEEIDHGAIIEQFEELIYHDDTFESLGKRLFEKSAERLESIITRYSISREAYEQDESKASFTNLLTRDDGFVSLSEKDGVKIEDLKLRIRAYYPWPGVWTKYDLNGKETIIKLLPNYQIQVEGKKSMSFRDFKNGYEKGSELLEKLGFKD